jgi:hypothetical protein
LASDSVAAAAPASRAVSFDLTPGERTRALVVLAIVLVLLLGVGLTLDRVTSQTHLPPGAFVPSAVPFPRTVSDPLTTSRSTRRGLGVAPTGQRWLAVKGVWGEGPDGARVITPVVGQPDYALVRVGRGDGSISVTAAHVVKGMGLAFRCQTELTCWTLTAATDFGTWQLTRIDGLNVIDMQNVGTAPVVDGTRLRIENFATGFDVYVNDQKVRHVDATEFNDKPRAGLVVAAEGEPTAARFTDFASEQVNIVGVGAPVRDAFDRPNGTDLGRAPTGQQWRVASGTWAIRDREAVLQSAPTLKPSVATVDTGRSQGWVQVTASVLPTGTGLVFRYQDAANYWWVDAVPQFGVLNIYRLDRGAPVKMGATPLTSFADGSTVTIRLRGKEITLFVDGFRAFDITSPFLRGARGAGMMIDSPKALGARFAGFAAGPLSIAGDGS